MFTGLVREVGRVAGASLRSEGAAVQIVCPAIANEIKRGDSVAVDGACLTAEEVLGEGFMAFASSETLRKTTLGRLRSGDRVNLEPAVRAGEMQGGHLVQGHVEGVGRVESLRSTGDGALLTVRLPEELVPFVVAKGSIAIAGISLTVAGLRENLIESALVPVTLGATTARSWKPGTGVNVETDILGRYIVSYLRRVGRPRGVTIEELVRKGF